MKNYWEKLGEVAVKYEKEIKRLEYSCGVLFATGLVVGAIIWHIIVILIFNYL